jgi:hypothetical protein
MKYQARPITETFWIIEFAGRKTGVMFKNDQGYSLIITGEDSLDGIQEQDIREFVEFLKPKKKEVSQTNNNIDGYEIEYAESFNHEWKEIGDNRVPVFTKTEQSKIQFAAGWYASEFPKTGWLTLFCPKFKTLADFTFTGPYKSKDDAQLAIKQAMRDK